VGETFTEGKILPTSMALSWRSNVVVEDGSGGMVQERRMHDAGAAGDGGAVQWRRRAGGISRRSQRFILNPTLVKLNMYDLSQL